MTENAAFTRRLIECCEFPFESISALAEQESWRKEVNRPIYHVHKWWAKRLGSVFRAVLLGSVLPEGADLMEEFYTRHDLQNICVLDPFMGSGTTIGEAQKLGMTSLGRDINPVACESVRVALAPIDVDRLKRLFFGLERDVGSKIRKLYKLECEAGLHSEVLYFFWVKQVACPECATLVDLFDSYVFARNAYPAKKPEVQVYCPGCGGVFEARYHDTVVSCPLCAQTFDVGSAPVRGQKGTCTSCHQSFQIARAVQSSQSPPKHRLFAKLVLMEEGGKQYLRATQADEDAFNTCERVLAEELERSTIRLPVAHLAEGYNTRQALSYNYRTWRDFFNVRQLLALGWLHTAIGDLPEGAEREALLLLFSGVLEFNNVFASYKGEGTGAVRHMFSHHVLKPERVPIEANVWGTSKSSGSFSGLFKSRLLRALEYRTRPFELSADGKVYGASAPLATVPIEQWPVDRTPTPGTVALSCGSSEDTGLLGNSVDLVITDPPFFDNVHYSELADFFYSWQVLEPRGFILGDKASIGETTRSSQEVQDGDARRFADKLQQVFSECKRVLKDDGLLVFTYHHSRADGWESLAQAVFDAGFSMSCVHPLRSEMAGGTPKSKAQSPILIDAVLVCSKAERDTRAVQSAEFALDMAVDQTKRQIDRLTRVGQASTRGDCSVLLTAQFFAALGPADGRTAAAAYAEVRGQLRAIVEELVDLSRIPTQPAAMPAAQASLGL